ncbi:hypothetical protein ACFL0L_03730 [Patescibacteria group bacterium]
MPEEHISHSNGRNEEEIKKPILSYIFSIIGFIMIVVGVIISFIDTSEGLEETTSAVLVGMLLVFGFLSIIISLLHIIRSPKPTSKTAGAGVARGVRTSIKIVLIMFALFVLYFVINLLLDAFVR